jgi:SAM-dependent methyltransferase
VKQLIKKYLDKTLDYAAFKLNHKHDFDESVIDNLAFRVASESILKDTTPDKKPYDIFNGISDEFWFWLNTEGVRRNSMLKSILPGAPSDSVQEMFTGSTGDATLREGFEYYKNVREQYEKYKGDISSAHKILDFGCGWGRIIRFFMKDIETSKIYGCDPVEDMIKICKEQNKYCNFELIDTYPPNSFQDNTFDLIYSYSIFSHFSEDFHLQLLHEIKRILKPGGIYITTTRNRDFFGSVHNLEN